MVNSLTANYEGAATCTPTYLEAVEWTAMVTHNNTQTDRKTQKGTNMKVLEDNHHIEVGRELGKVTEGPPEVVMVKTDNPGVVNRVRQESTPAGLVFQGSGTPFSNMHTVNIEHENTTYPSSEHLYQTIKLKKIGLEKESQQIIHCKSPFDAKYMADRYKKHETAQWLSVERYKVMVFVSGLKYRQNAEARKALFLSLDKVLIEGTKDAFFGRGDFLGSPLYEAGLIDGPNNLGKILMELRTSLKIEFKNEYDLIIANLKPTENPPPPNQEEDPPLRDREPNEEGVVLHPLVAEAAANGDDRLRYQIRGSAA